MHLLLTTRFKQPSSDSTQPLPVTTAGADLPGCKLLVGAVDMVIAQTTTAIVVESMMLYKYGYGRCM